MRPLLMRLLSDQIRPKVVLGLAVLFVVLLPGPAFHDDNASAHGKYGQPLGVRIIHQVDHKRRDTWRCQDELGLRRTPTAYTARRSPSIAYRRWVMRLWGRRAAECARWRRAVQDPVTAIRAVFGPYASQAISVAECESDPNRVRDGYIPPSAVRASNGQYLGMFQMGEWGRSQYGHGPTAIDQARAAYRYFVASGRDWSPWECKP